MGDPADPRMLTMTDSILHVHQLRQLLLSLANDVNYLTQTI